MDLILGTSCSNPNELGSNVITKCRAGFIKLHLHQLHIDNIALLKGHHALVMDMENGDKVIGKIEKGFELITKARNLQLDQGQHIMRHTRT